MGLQLTQLQIGAFLKCSTASARAAIIYADAHETLLAQILLQQRAAPCLSDIPCVLHLLVARSAVLIHHHGIFPVRVEICRLHHPSVQHHTVGRCQREQFTLAKIVRTQTVSQGTVLHKRLQHLPLAVAQRADGRRIHVAPRMDEVFEVAAEQCHAPS